MEIRVDIPESLAGPLEAAHGPDLGRAAIEQLALEGYRTGKLSRYQVQQLLGFDNRYETEDWLGRSGVRVNYSLSDLQADRDTLDRILNR